jgi:hypothetical protein
MHLCMPPPCLCREQHDAPAAYMQISLGGGVHMHMQIPLRGQAGQRQAVYV